MTRLIDADALKKIIHCEYSDDLGILDKIDNSPTVPLPDFKEGYKQAILDGKTNYSRQQEWIPIKTRPLAEEEKEEYPDYSFMYDCHLPEDGEEVLVTTYGGRVTLDTFYRDDGCYFECYCDEGDVLAWMPLPKPYKKESDND